MRYKYDLDFVQQLCRLTELQRRDLLRYYTRLPELVRIEAHRLQTDQIRQHRHQMQAGYMAEFSYAMLLIALQMMRSVEHTQQRGSLTMEQVQMISEIRIARAKVVKKRKKSPIRHQVEVQYFEEIKRLRVQEGLSWREIAAYLKKYRRLKISHAYLQTLFKELLKMNH
jgi:hypothetical protein